MKLFEIYQQVKEWDNETNDDKRFFLSRQTQIPTSGWFHCSTSNHDDSDESYAEFERNNDWNYTGLYLSRRPLTDYGPITHEYETYVTNPYRGKPNQIMVDAYAKALLSDNTANKANDTSGEYNTSVLDQEYVYNYSELFNYQEEIDYETKKAIKFHTDMYGQPPDEHDMAVLTKKAKEDTVDEKMVKLYEKLMNDFIKNGNWSNFLNGKVKSQIAMLGGFDCAIDKGEYVVVFDPTHDAKLIKSYPNR